MIEHEHQSLRGVANVRADLRPRRVHEWPQQGDHMLVVAPVYRAKRRSGFETDGNVARVSGVDDRLDLGIRLPLLADDDATHGLARAQRLRDCMQTIDDLLMRRHRSSIRS